MLLVVINRGSNLNEINYNMNTCKNYNLCLFLVQYLLSSSRSSSNSTSVNSDSALLKSNPPVPDNMINGMKFGNCNPTWYNSFRYVIRPPGMKHKARYSTLRFT
jgi:hypothetical protein